MQRDLRMTNAMRGLQGLVRNRRTWTSPYKIAPNWHCTFLRVAMKRSDLKNEHQRTEYVAEGKIRTVAWNVGAPATHSSINAGPHGGTNLVRTWNHAVQQDKSCTADVSLVWFQKFVSFGVDEIA